MTNLHLLRTDNTHPDLADLIRALDQELKIRDGEDHAFYNQFNGLNNIQHVILAYQEGQAVACGALKRYDAITMEIKRMYVSPSARKQGIASQVLQALEQWAYELQAQSCILETGTQQPEAIQLYQKNAYQRIPNYAQYEGVTNSICMEKKMTDVHLHPSSENNHPNNF
ncbi:MAG: GNAT family N-acetyltransferase [Bacteroidota bacterium]